MRRQLTGLALVLGVAFIGSSIGATIAYNLPMPDPHNYNHAKHWECAAIGKLSNSYHNGKCD